jgi:hypothetical protein
MRRRTISAFANIVLVVLTSRQPSWRSGELGLIDDVDWHAVPSVQRVQ